MAWLDTFVMPELAALPRHVSLNPHMQYGVACGVFYPALLYGIWTHSTNHT